MPERIYLANGTEKFNGDIIEFSLNLSKMDQAKEFMFEFNGDTYIKLKVVKKRPAVYVQNFPDCLVK